MELSEYIIQQISEHGPVSFREFMEMCLYSPDQGYYTSKRNPIGQEGDFYTSTNLTPVFGITIGRQLEEMWRNMDECPFTIVEYGAGTGRLCKDILCYLKGNTKMYRQLRYCVIEKSPTMRDMQEKYLTDQVEWHQSIAEIQGINGCILSNELVDNFAVYRVVMQKELMEVYVDYQHGFTEELRPAKPELKNYFSELGITLPYGYHTEINLQALDWIADVAGALNRGYVLTIDYGYQNAAMYKANRNQGTLVCYYKHTVNDSCYEHIGEQDMSCHVNFSALSHWGTKNGLKESGFTDQGSFLTALGFRERLIQSLVAEQDIVYAAQHASAINHALLMDMGTKYKVLIQEKGLNGKKLSGLSGCVVV